MKTNASYKKPNEQLIELDKFPTENVKEHRIGMMKLREFELYSFTCKQTIISTINEGYLRHRLDDCVQNVDYPSIPLSQKS